ncbi:hypothetical protein ATE84_2053 [Aquimarina sp. MAR_2010_214]|uniref:hypothetical protein n=1 Tax=Aquimarina sp. MAR_2010_214 TaxID=1250026 RepID=UPI000C6FF8D4|nr:hypothetical protein [Aquimarina sp. MAR_2010_214]PKV50007.1 hypothetical protein ATE84_2053 [Aquimarina sp. MAR_2010_214]
MKPLQLIIIAFFIIQWANAQSIDTSKTSEKTVKKDNLLDMQANLLSGVFGENLDGKSNGKTISFLELLEKMDLPAEQKLEYKNMYYLQAKKLTQKQKDSLGAAIEKKILEAKNHQ